MFEILGEIFRILLGILSFEIWEYAWNWTLLIRFQSQTSGFEDVSCKLIFEAPCGLRYTLSNVVFFKLISALCYHSDHNLEYTILLHVFFKNPIINIDNSRIHIFSLNLFCFHLPLWVTV
jgi:hypothetical protein